MVDVSGMLLPACSIFFSSLLFYLYFSKDRVDLLENKMYGAMIVCTLVDSVLVTFLQFLSLREITNAKSILITLLNKIDFIFLVTLSTCFFLYTIMITFTKAKKDLKKYIYPFCIFDLIVFILIVFLKIDIISIGTNYSVTGTAAVLTVAVCLLYILASLFVAFSNIKKRDKRYIPIYFILPMFLFLILLYNINPYLIVISITLCFIDYIMYFTIENPDLKMIEQLNIAKDQADRANNAKTEFLSSMSHEIRTPLNAIDGFSQLILEEDNIDTIKEEARDIMVASQNLLEIVNGILDISKIEADKLEIVNVEYEPSKVFDDLVKLIKARIGEKPLDFRVNIAKDLPDYLDGDYARLKQIVLNLLTNAVKYTKEGFVEFNVSAVKKNKVCRLIISVKDSGIGIKKENISKLFTKFERFDKEKNLTIEGTGLGLAITKKLVDLMHGNITVDSVYGKGSTFMVAIDQKIVDKKKVKVADAVVKKDNKINIKGKKVLIVDDNLINLKVADRLLLSYKLVTECVSSGFECIEKSDEGNKYDLILMDDMMPKMSGVETFKKLKKMDNFNVPVIALTANAIAGMKENYLKEGFNDYISKPIDKKELERVLKEFLK